jgi:alkanesulfonate monooxygenase SsuD/methylene tetrahydromethanopterin reductase-like flavin-dependent oxidoreductase (luciferase family)
MRALWTRELVTAKGKWHSIPDAGINPLPIQRPIPIWMGGDSEAVLRRASRVAEGWMPHFRPGMESQAVVDRLRGFMKEAGRDPAAFGIEGRMTPSQLPADQWGKELAAWRAMRGITHLCVHTVGLGLKTPDDHIQVLQRFKKEAMST